MLPLEGVTVVSVEQAVAAPFATRQLADLGARVIKIERVPDGDFARDYDDVVMGMASYFVWLNRSKESVCLDLKHPAAAEVVDRLMAKADVFVQNLAPGAAERLGLGSERLRTRWPSLVVCNVSGYGTEGPYRDKKAYDLLVQCETGLVSITGSPESPAKVGISVADIAAGMYGYSAILAALISRQRTGLGSTCEVSLFDALTEWMSHPLYHALYGEKPLERAGTSHASIAPYGSFRTGDGKTVQLGIQNDREWRLFCEHVLQQAELAADPRFSTNPLRVANRCALTETIEAVFEDLSAAAVVERLDAAHIANARLNEVTELIDHPQLVARRRWTEVDSPVGPIRALYPPVIFDGGDEVPMAPIPGIGEHTMALLEELGFDEKERQRLQAIGVV
jgi:itaconate CoA-transferase